jgi:hypothetical protein
MDADNTIGHLTPRSLSHYAHVFFAFAPLLWAPFSQQLCKAVPGTFNITVATNKAADEASRYRRVRVIRLVSWGSNGR